MKQKIRIAIYILIGVLIVVIGSIALFNNNANKEKFIGAEEQLNLGNTYLLELSYEKAVLTFTEAVEIEPNNPDAYIGLAKAYVGLDNVPKAIEALELGYERTSDERLREMIEELGDIEEVTSVATTEVTTTEATTTTEETTTTEVTTEEQYVIVDIIEEIDETTEITTTGVTTEATTETTTIAEEKVYYLPDFEGMTMGEIAKIYNNEYELKAGQYGNYGLYIAEADYLFFPYEQVYDASEFSMDFKVSDIETHTGYVLEGIKSGEKLKDIIDNSRGLLSWDKVFIESVNDTYAYSLTIDNCDIWFRTNTMQRQATDSIDTYKDDIEVWRVIATFN